MKWPWEDESPFSHETLEALAENKRLSEEPGKEIEKFNLGSSKAAQYLQTVERGLVVDVKV